MTKMNFFYGDNIDLANELTPICVEGKGITPPQDKPGQDIGDMFESRYFSGKVVGKKLEGDNTIQYLTMQYDDNNAELDLKFNSAFSPLNYDGDSKLFELTLAQCETMNSYKYAALKSDNPDLNEVVGEESFKNRLRVLAVRYKQNLSAKLDAVATSSSHTSRLQPLQRKTSTPFDINVRY